MCALNFDVVVVGGGIASAQAAVTAKASCRSASVSIISNETQIYSRAALRSVISGSLKSIDDIIVYRAEDMESFKIRVFPGYEVLSVNHNEHFIRAKSRFTSDFLSFKYDKLILATGSVPAIPPISGFSLLGVFTVKWFNEALSLSQYVTPGMRAYVVGAGFIGLEIAEALAKRGLKTTLIVRSRVLRGLLEPDLSWEVTRRIKSHGVNVLTGVTLEEVGGKRKVEYITIGNKKFAADVVVVAIGMQPNTSIANQIGLQLAENNAIKTDACMMTSLEDVYAAGDCAETLDFVTGKPVYRPIGSIAASAAKIAGSNAVGVEKVYDGFLRTQYDRIFQNEIISIGLSTEEASKLGIHSEAIDVCLKEVKYPLLSQLTPANALMKAIIDRDTDAIIGWQVIGSKQCSWAFLLFQEMIRKRRSVSNIQELGLNIK